MLNQAHTIPPMNLQLFAEVDDGSDMFLDAEQTSEADEMAEKEQTEDLPADEAEEQGEQEKPADEKAEQTDPATIRVKYNGEEKDITLEEARTLAQKGMNYDKVAQQLDELKKIADPDVMREIGLWAKQSGMPVKEFVKTLSTQREQALVDSMLKAVQEEFPDMPDEAAAELAKARAEKKRGEDADAAAKTKAAEDAENLKPWQEFVEEFKITDANQLPPDVLEAITGGANPVTAMLRHDNAELKKKIAELESKAETEAKNKENKQKAIGKAASDGAETPKDAFLMGFLS